MASSRNEKQPHAIMISVHLQGHIIPFINLALKLASNGFTVTFAHLEFIHHQITTSQDQTTGIDIFSEARKSGLDINYATISDGFPVEFDRSNNLDQFLESYIDDFPSRVDEFVGEIMRTHLSSDFEYFLVADTFSFWAAEIAEKYEMVCVSFWTEPAIVYSLYHHLELLKEHGHVPVNGRQEDVDYVPGIRAINTKDFMSYLQESELTLLHRAIFRAFDDVKRLDFILCNTVEELEAEAVSVLQKNQPFYTIGPLFPRGDLLKVLIPRSLLPELDCTEWLNTKAPGSVLYVSFGSLATTEKNVILEIATGILLSGVNFIWVLRPGIVGSDEDGMLPVGFQDRVKDQGVIVPWCKQWQVLSNPGIGGFLTHCGWNSVLESIWFGVPMICYPLFTDQITNRKLVVDDWKAGLNLCDEKHVKRDEVVEKIGTLMDEEKSLKLRQEIRKLRNTLKNASSEDGSSERNFARFVKDLKNKVLAKCESLRS